jgi:excisionase family DNA binding protein
MSVEAPIWRDMRIAEMKRNGITRSTESSTPSRSVLYRITTVMQLLDVSRATVYRMIASGELERVKLGSRTSRIKSTSVERVMSGRTGED